VVVSDEYGAYSKLEYVLNSAEEFSQYHSTKAINDGMIDYKINKKERHIRNDKLNSYVK
jgi:hypothetical protein